MASLEEINFQPAETLAADDSAAGGALTIAAAAASTSFKYVVTALLISASDAPTGAVAAEVRASGGAVTFTLRLPAAAYAPIFINFAQTPLIFGAGEEPELFVPGHGGATVVSGALFGRMVRV
jgi:hypothetical protein